MHDWLDKIIAEQASHYGLPVEAFAELMDEAAEHQEKIEQTGEDE